MTDTITVSGVVATEPKHVVTSEGLRITSFRLASQQRRYDRAQSKWVDAETNWFTVTAFRQLAEHAAASLHKGERVIARGRLRLREWSNGERAGTTVEVEADGIGHDLAWGTSEYHRVARTAEPEPGQEGPGEPSGAPDAIGPAEPAGDRAELAPTPF